MDVLTDDPNQQATATCYAHTAMAMLAFGILSVIAGIICLVVKAAKYTVRAMDLQDCGLLLLGLGVAGVCCMIYDLMNSNNLKKMIKG